MQQCPQCQRLKPEAAQLCDCGWFFENDDPSEEAPELPELRQQFEAGANWFYWIAGLTIVTEVFESAAETQVSVADYMIQESFELNSAS